jgi:hypothetical protein
MMNLDEAFEITGEPELARTWQKYVRPEKRVLFVGAIDMYSSPVGLVLAGVHVDSTALMGGMTESLGYRQLQEHFYFMTEEHGNGQKGEAHFFTDYIQDLPRHNGGRKYSAIVLPLVLDEVRNDGQRKSLVEALFQLSDPRECAWFVSGFLPGYVEKHFDPLFEAAAQKFDWQWHKAGSERFRDHEYQMIRHYVWKNRPTRTRPPLPR